MIPFHQNREAKSIYTTSLHWISNIAPVVFILIGLTVVISSNTSLFTVISKLINKPMEVVFSEWLYLLNVMLFLKGVYSLLINMSIRIVLYENQLTLKGGLFSKFITDIPLNKYEGLELHQSFLGRILAYGSLVVTTGGVSQRYKIKKPLELRENIINQLNK